MYTYEEAVTYFDTEVLHNQAWLEADENTRKRALKNAENELYTNFSVYNPETKPLPNNAVFEQALWLLRQDTNIQQAEMGVTNVNLSGEISISFSGGKSKIAPNVLSIIRKSRKVGRYL